LRTRSGEPCALEIDTTLRDEQPAAGHSREELDQLAFQRFCELLPSDMPSGELDLDWRKMGNLAMSEGLIAPMTAGELEAGVIAKVSNIAPFTDILHWLKCAR
jgi:hypothetical protein